MNCKMNVEDLSEEPFCCRHRIAPHTSFIYHDSTGPNASRTQFVGNEWGVPRESVFCRDIQIGSTISPHSSIRYRLWETTDEVLGGECGSHFHVEVTTRHKPINNEAMSSSLAHIREDMHPAMYITSEGAIVFNYVNSDRSVGIPLAINREGIVYMPGYEPYMNTGLMNEWQTFNNSPCMARILKNDTSAQVHFEVSVSGIESKSGILPVVFGVSFLNDSIENMLGTVERMIIAHAHDRIPSDPNMLRHIVDPYMYIYSQ